MSDATVVRPGHAVIRPATHVVGPVPGWTGCSHVTLIAPPMGARFTMALVTMEAGAAAGPPRPGMGRALYVLEGAPLLEAGDVRRALGPGQAAHLPPGTLHSLTADAPARVCVIDKPHVPLPGGTIGGVVVTDGAAVTPEPLLGDPRVRVRALLPEEPSLDMALNLMTFDPGAALPFTECHVMEHGLLVLEGTLVYGLGERWYRVGPGDAIWMGPFCPQWCCAYGPEPATYLISKDWNRDPA